MISTWHGGYLYFQQLGGVGLARTAFHLCDPAGAFAIRYIEADPSRCKFEIISKTEDYISWCDVAPHMDALRRSGRLPAPDGRVRDPVKYLTDPKHAEYYNRCLDVASEVCALMQLVANACCEFRSLSAPQHLAVTNLIDLRGVFH